MQPLLIQGSDVNQIYHELMLHREEWTTEEDSRNGPVYAFTAPVLIAYHLPYRRVLFDPARDANPFFHYMEAIWMLSGSENLDFLSRFTKGMARYSDDDLTLNGAYGFRWRMHFEDDQIEQIIELLRNDPTTRRAVLTMWDANYDLGSTSKDIPCNTHAYFRIVDRKLDMTVCNRSNDLVWGALGANVVHMSVLQEYLAESLRIGVGTYYQFTNTLHIYPGMEEDYDDQVDQWYSHNPTYNRWMFSPDNLSIAEAQDFVEFGLDTEEPFKGRIIRDNATPMFLAYAAYRVKDIPLALHHAGKIYDEDWRYACVNWLNRRHKDE